MEDIGNYVLSLVSGALVCSILMGILPSGHFAAMGKFLCGVFLTISFLQPLTELDMTRIFSGWLQLESQNAEAIAALGQSYSQNLLASRIKQDAEEYILDKAASLGASLSAEILLSDDELPIPVKVNIYGNISSSAKEELGRYITRDLGISKENQLWIQKKSENG